MRTWRKSQRTLLIEQRVAVWRENRASWNKALTGLLEQVIPSPANRRTLGIYWPFKAEYDPRPLARMLNMRGMRLALPVVVEQARPLIVRMVAWYPYGAGGVGHPSTR
jgi:5-formyltetrahydrofolate cyclo-ligase